MRWGRTFPGRALLAQPVDASAMAAAEAEMKERRVGGMITESEVENRIVRGSEGFDVSLRIACLSNRLREPGPPGRR